MLMRRIADSMGPVGGAASCAAVVCGVVVLPDAQAGYGAYTPGVGARSTAVGGIVYSLVQDTTPLSSNPALAQPLGTRADLTLEYDGAYSDFYIHDNLLGRDQAYQSSARHFFFPQAGIAVALSEELSFAMTGFLAGFGAEYKDSPLARFGGDDEASLYLNQAGVSTVLAYEVLPEQSIGLSLNLSYDLLDVKGLGAFANFSETPEHFTDQGRDGVLGVGVTIGWYGRLTPWLSAGLGYRSKTWATGRIKKYEGLLPEQGNLEFPAFYGGGFAVTPHPDWTIAVEVQQVAYSDEVTFSNSLAQIRGNRFGSDDGPGFGWKTQDIARLGIVYQPSHQLTLRAGYSHGTAQMPRSETLLGAFAPNTGRSHYSLGGTWARDDGWEFTVAVAYAPNVMLRGRDSIPAIAGGGEADVEIHAPTVDLSVSRRFDFQFFERP